MIGDNVYQTFDLTVAPGATQKMVIDGVYVACLSATDRFLISIDDGPTGTFEKGMSLAYQMPFAKIEVSNDTAATIQIELGISSGKIRDARLNVSGSIVSEQARPPVFADAAPVAVTAGPATTLLIAANTKRAEAILVNTGTVGLWVKGSATVSKTGTYIAPGQPVTLSSTAALYAYNPDAATAGEMSIAETEFV